MMTSAHSVIGRVLVVSLFLAIGVIAACGDGSGDAPPVTPPNGDIEVTVSPQESPKPGKGTR